MFAAHYSAEALTLVTVHVGTHTAETFARAVGAAERLAADMRRGGGVGRWISLIDGGAEPPNASQRKQMAEVNASFGRLHVALVTSSRMHRAIITGLHWLTPPGAGQKYATFGAVGDAVAWHEENAGAPLRPLRELVARAQAEARRAGAMRLGA